MEFAKIAHFIPQSARVASTDFVHPRYTHFDRSYDYSNYRRKVSGYEAKVPDEAQVRVRLKLIGYRRVVLDEKKLTVGIGKGQRIDLGGIAKGFATDRAGAALTRAGLTSYMVQAGGDLLARGKKGQVPWHIGIRDPRGKRGSFFAVAPIVDHAFSTSGDYERFFFQNGKR